VPKLNLGIKRLLTPGQNDDMMLEEFPLIIEYLSDYTRIPVTEAEEIVTQKLENYYMKQKMFQLDKEHVRKFLKSLTEKITNI
jgi:hypothetical protein